MSDKKTIQDALAEIQRKVNEERVRKISEMYASLDEAMPEITIGGKKVGTKGVVPKNKAQEYIANKEGTKVPPSGNQNLPGSAPVKPKSASVSDLTKSSGTTAKTLGKLGAAASVAGNAGIGAAALGGMASGALGALATGTETGREIGRKIGQTEIGKTVADYARKAGEAIGVREPSKPTETPKSTASSTPKPAETPKEKPAATTPSAPKPAEASKPSSFSAAFKAAREKATAAGKPSTGQFEFQGKKYQTNIKGEKYVSAPKQTKVDTGSTAAVKPATSTTTNPNRGGLVPSHMGNILPGGKLSSGDLSSTPIKNQDTSMTTAKAPGTFTGTNLNPEKTPTTATRVPTGVPDIPGSAATPKNATSPTGGFIPPKNSSTSPEYESGKKAKKMSEETNPLIAAFLKLQDENPGNMFEAAKKAKKDYDKDGKIESPKDEVWGSRFRAAKAAGKMEEGALDPKDPSVQGSGDVTSTPAKAPVHVKPTNPEKIKNMKDPRDPSVQGSGDVTYKEEVELDEMRDRPKKDDVNRRKRDAVAMKIGHNNPEGRNNNYNAPVSMLKHGRKLMKQGVTKEETEVTFSQAEIDHINSFFLEASVAPNRPEVAAGADSTSDKMSQNDVTGTSTESGKKKLKEGTWSSSRMSNPRPMSLSSGGGLDPEKRKALAASMAKYKPNMKAGESDEEYKARTTKNAASQRAAVGMKEETLEEGRPKKNPQPETTERDPRKHIQVEAGRAAAGNVVDFTHNDGSKSKLTPAMGRRIVAHLQGLKPADRQAAVNKMHDSAEGLKV